MEQDSEQDYRCNKCQFSGSQYDLLMHYRKCNPKLFMTKILPILKREEIATDNSLNKLLKDGMITIAGYAEDGDPIYQITEKGKKGY